MFLSPNAIAQPSGNTTSEAFQLLKGLCDIYLRYKLLENQISLRKSSGDIAKLRTLEGSLIVSEALLGLRFVSSERYDHPPNHDHTDELTGLACCARLKLFASASRDGTIKVWNGSNDLVRWESPVPFWNHKPTPCSPVNGSISIKTCNICFP